MVNNLLILVCNHYRGMGGIRCNYIHIATNFYDAMKFTVVVVSAPSL